MEKYKVRAQEVQNLLDNDVIDLKKLRDICSQGCPNQGSIRSLVWKLFLNYLPSDRRKWKDFLLKRRNEYREFVLDIIIRPGLKNSEDDCEEFDHPLNSGPKSEWDIYFKDNQILVQIDKDVRRLCPDLFFFQKATEFPCQEIKNATNGEQYESLRKRVASTQLKADEVCKNRLGITNFKSEARKKEEDNEYAYLPDGKEAHWEIVQRILFIFAKLNPGNSYVQGMNEICGPLYYTFANEPDIEWRRNAEADCFFCLTNLIGLEGVRENFVPALDNSQCGIGSNMKRLYDLVRVKDLTVYNVLEKQNLKPEFFAFRWLTLLLSQEFQLPDVIALWDCLFSDLKPFDFLMHICCAMIIIQRENLIKGDFSNNIKVLQSYPPTDIQQIISLARKLRQR